MVPFRSSRLVRWPRRSALLALAVLTFAAGGDAAAAQQAPCSTRYTIASEFPPMGRDGRPLEPAQIASLLGNKGWGVIENLTLRPGADGPGQVLEVRIPRGSINPGHPTAPMGGMGFRWDAGIPTGTTAACLAYSVWLPKDFAFNKGGKLPGLFGGDGPAGGKDVDGTTGFSIRFMWRRNGAGEVYAYIPGKPDGRGLSIERGAFTFPRGRWLRLEQEAVLNMPGAADGALRVWADGQLVIEQTSVVYRTRPDVTFAGVMADIFYGGKADDWAAPQDTLVRLTPFEIGWR